MAILCGDTIRILDNGTAPSRYKDKVVSVDLVDRGSMVDGNIYRVWDNDDEIYYSFDENQIEIAR